MSAVEREAKAFLARRAKKSPEQHRENPDPAGAPRALGTLRAWLQSSAWTPLAGKAFTWAAAFIALAAVGSGAAVQFLPGSGDAHLAGLLGSPAQQADHAPQDDHAPRAAPPAESTAPAAGPTKLGAGAADAGLPAADGGPPSSGITADGKVILNLATEEDLRRLSGIGPAKAKAILALRAKLGRFKRVEDLLRVKGIGRKRLARLRPLVVLDP
jgi:competence protein ComEA